MTELTTIAAHELREVLQKYGVPPSEINTLDAEYLVPSEHDVQNKLATKFTEVLEANNYLYVPEANDCENFAAFLWGWATFFHSKQNKVATAGKGLALGLICNSEMGHAFNFAIHQSDAEVLYVAAYEPQRDGRGFTCTKIPMTPTLWSKCFLAVC